MRRSRPPRIVETLVACAAPPAMRDHLLGDLQEGFVRQQRRDGTQNATRWYVSQAIRSLPCLLRYRLTAGGARSLLATLVHTAVLVGLVTVWELNVAKANAWPITARFLEQSPVSGTILWMSIYVALYASGALPALVAFKWIRKAGPREQPGGRGLPMLATALALPAIYYMVRPEPLDSLGFRIVQVSMAWCLLGAAAHLSAARTRLRRG